MKWQCRLGKQTICCKMSFKWREMCAEREKETGQKNLLFFLFTVFHGCSIIYWNATSAPATHSLSILLHAVNVQMGEKLKGKTT